MSSVRTIFFRCALGGALAITLFVGGAMPALASGGRAGVVSAPRSISASSARLSAPNGTFISSGGRYAVVAGGAALPVVNWAAIGRSGPPAYSTEVSNAGWNFVTGVKPSSGTKLYTLSGPGYVVAGGAALYVSRWANVGGPRGAVLVDPAGLSRLNRQPSNGTKLYTLSGPGYVVAGGAALYVSRWANVGGPPGAVLVDPAGLSGLNQRPWNGTKLYTLAGPGYVVAGGAAVPVMAWANVGGSSGAVLVDPASFTQQLAARPANGTKLYVLQGPGFIMSNGYAQFVTDWGLVGGSSGAVLIDDVALFGLTPPAAPGTYASSLAAGQMLASGQMLQSSDGYLAVMHTDGNFVVYSPSRSSVFQTATYQHPGAYLVVRRDGSAVVVYGGAVIWSSQTASLTQSVPASLELKNGGNLVLSALGVPMWSSWSGPMQCSGSGCTVQSTYETHGIGSTAGRDCGYGEPIGLTGRSFWIFCDTPVRPAGQGLGFIPGSTAAIGDYHAGFAPKALTEVPSGLPHQFLPTPVGLTLENGNPCGSNGTSFAASWTTGMTSEPWAPTVMLITYSNYCVDSSNEPNPFYFQGYGVSEYDTRTGSMSSVQNVLNWSSAYNILGSPVIDMATNSLYLYSSHCDQPYIGCYAGVTFMVRVSLGSNPAATKPWNSEANYQYWTGTRWAWGASSGVGSIRPSDQTGLSVSVGRYPTLGNAYVMVTQADIGGGYTIFTSPSPTGPWTFHSEGKVATCASQPGAFCYAFIGHPELSTSDQLAFTTFIPSLGHPTLELIPW